MIISESWLREWVNPALDTAQLAERLTLAGLEVGTVEPAAAELKKVVVGEVLDIEPHPDADKLRVCRVDIGARRPLTIVCGAPNAAQGIKTPVALVGAELPGGFRIRRSKIRGVASSGMLCSAAELGLEESSAGLLLLEAGATPGQPIAETLQLDDRLLEIDLTPNRGDCLSVAGIAREVAALTGSKLKPVAPGKSRARCKDRLPIELQAAEDCPRYVGRILRDIDIHAQTPLWMKEKLRRAGVRSIQPVVDVTNYVMLELGQPMHAFDLEKIDGGIVVRRGGRREKLTLLDGSEVTLSPETLVIADHKKAVALAGIMGGENSAIGDATRHILLESAFFRPAVIAGRARRDGMQTDASHRFERGVDPALQVRAIDHATELLLRIVGGVAGPVLHAVERRHLPKRKAATLRPQRIERILGIKIPVRRINALLEGLGMDVKPARNGCRVTPPTWRFDIEGEHDLIEEVGRTHGFDAVPPRLPVTRATAGARREAEVPLQRLQQMLVDRDYFEAITYSFVDPAVQQRLVVSAAPAIRLANPIADSMSVMRESLWPGLLAAVKTNLNRQQSRVRLFENGNVFWKQGRQLREQLHIGGAVTGKAFPPQWGCEPREIDFFDLKSDVEALCALGRRSGEFRYETGEHPALHPGMSAGIRLGKKIVGHLGRLHPDHQKVLEIEQPVYLFELQVEPLTGGLLPAFRPVSRFPATRRDLAVIVDESIPAAAVLNVVREAAGEMLAQLELFDIYRGKGVEKNKKSLAFSLTLQAESSSLKASEAEEITENIVAALRTTLNAELRA